MNVTAAIHARLAGDATLIGLLATYEGEPAIFTDDPAPADATLPYLVTAGAVVTVPFDTKTSRGRVVTRDVRGYTAASAASSDVEEIAERVYELLHRHRLVVAGHTTWIAEAFGPRSAPREEEVHGRIVTVRWTIEQE